MTRKVSLALAVAGLLALFAWSPWAALAQKAPVPQWVWYPEGNPLVEAPSATRYFRKSFTVEKDVKTAMLEITADNRFVVWVNGTQVGEGDTWATLYRFDVKKHLKAGNNVIAVEASNEGGPAGLVVRLSHGPALVVTDASWRTAKEVAKGWQNIDASDEKWARVKVLGPYGKVGPWTGGGAAAKAGTRRFTVPDGFRVEEVVKRARDRGPFSFVNMTFDARGRLLLSQEGGPIVVCEKPDDKGVFQEVRDYCTQVRNSHGMCWVGDSLLLVGDGPRGTGLYRCRDTKNADRIDEVTLLHRFQGGMGEHGPHAIIHGPDGWLYVVVGNHAWLRIGKGIAPNPEKLADHSPLRRWPTGGQGPDQGKPGSTEDVLLPRLNDANGHAANILAPGGTIWRMDHKGQALSLVAAGFRNQFDAAFNPVGELFSFDSDMEWDEALPWYRDVRIVHAPPGADFGWRTGSSKIPAYALDTLPPLHDTGRGSPVGVCGYDHPAYGPRYRGAVFCADWSIGVLYAVLPKVKGATYAAEVEKFCVGSPMNITDVETGPDGALYMTLGGRGSQGGIFRIVKEGAKPTTHTIKDARDIATIPQPQSAWSRAAVAAFLKKGDAKATTAALLKLAADDKDADLRVRALTALPTHGLTEHLDPAGVRPLITDAEPAVRAQAVWLLGLVGGKGDLAGLEKALSDESLLVRRRACEALVRLNLEPKVEALWPLLSDGDRFLRTAARLVLERISPEKWGERLGKGPRLATLEGIVALCKTGQAAAHADAIFARLQESLPEGTPAADRLDWARVVQLACFHVAKPPEAAVKKIAAECLALFPATSPQLSRELAILLTHFGRTKTISTPVQGKLLDALLAAKADRQQQIHYFYCLRLLSDGWTAEQAEKLAAWYETTRDWKGGHSFPPFLANIFREAVGAFDTSARRALLARAAEMPHAARVLAQRLGNERAADLLPDVKKAQEAVKDSKRPGANELRAALAEVAVRIVLDRPRPEHLPDLVRALDSTNKVMVFDALSALAKLDAKPKPEDAASYRAVMMAARRIDAGNRWKAVEVLRNWSSGRQFGSDKGDWGTELRAWSRWFAQAFPKEPALPGIEGDKPTPSKYKYADLLEYVTKGEGRTGDAKRGRVVFEKAQCLKCHKYGKEGEGVGPDLTMLSKRFKRPDVLESLYYPSKVISDQYRSTLILTKKGVRIDGLMAVQGDMISVLQQDGSKVTLRKRDIEQQYASLVSVMPEKLLDALTLQEIADLFAFLESEPSK